MTNPSMTSIEAALKTASQQIYAALKAGQGLSLAGGSNATGDDQIGLDILADEAFVDALSEAEGVRSIMSEERPDLIEVGKGSYTIALDPLDGSKSALYGVPCGAIFGIFEGVDAAKDLQGGNIIGSGFFVFGLNLELYIAYNSGVYKSTFDDAKQTWSTPIALPAMPSANVFAVNVSGISYWDAGLREHYYALHRTDTPPKGRWFASLVLDVKRLILQGGMFAYPASTLKGYEAGHLRLVYEGIPMAFLVQALGGASSDGAQSLLDKTPTDLHEKTPVFLGEADKTAAIERIMSKG